MRMRIGGGWLGLLVAAVAAWAGDRYESAGFLEFPPEAKVGAMSGVDVDKRGHVYVLHRGEQPVAKFDAKGKYLKSWGAGMFKVPHVIRVGPDGNIWTTDNGNHVLRVFTPEGQLLRTIGELNVSGNDGKHFRAPDDIVFGAKGSYYVADAGNARIAHFDAAGNLTGQWGKKGKGPGEFSTAHSLALDKKGRVYVGDRGNKRIQVFDGEGKFLEEWTGFGNAFGMLIAGNEMIASEGDAHQLIRLGLADGKVIEQWGAQGEFQLPHMMAAAKGGRIYVTEVNGKRVQILKRRAQ